MDDEQSTYPEWITNTRIGRIVYYAVGLYAIGKGSLKGLAWSLKEMVK